METHYNAFTMLFLKRLAKIIYLHQNKKNFVFVCLFFLTLKNCLDKGQRSETKLNIVFNKT